MKYRVVFSPESLEQLAELYRYIAGATSPEVVFIIGVFYGGQDYETILHDQD